jgi:hypothetical protein
MKPGLTLGEGNSTLAHSATKTGGAPWAAAYFRTGPKIHDGLRYLEIWGRPDLQSPVL